MSRSPGNSDYANAGTKHTAENDQEDARTTDIVSFSELLGTLRDQLALNGYRLYPSQTGRFCMYDVYKADTPDLEGLEYPSDFRYYRQIQPWSDKDRCQFLATVRSLCENQKAIAPSEGHARKWVQICLDFEDRASDPRSNVARIAIASVNDVSPRQSTYTGRSGFHKFVPPVSWFPKKVQDLDCSQLLTLLPPVERDQFMLILGRVVAGAKGTVVAEGILEHTARSYAIVVGIEPGLGKSTMIGYIETALAKLGYITSQLNADFNKFGWGSIATADLATIDDLTDSTQLKMIQDPRVKSIVSNNFLKTEEKGIAAVDVRATSVIIGLTNSSNYAHYLGTDPGCLSRLNQLDTYTSYELRQVYPGIPDARIKPFWEATAARLGVTTELLAVRLLRHCLDLFLEVTGHSFDPTGHLVKDLDTDRLEDRMKANRTKFRINVSLKHAEEIPTVASHLAALTIAEARPDRRANLEHKLAHLDFSPEIVRIIIELFSASPILPKGLEGLQLNHLSKDCIRYIKPKLRDFEALASTQSVEGAFKVLALELKSTIGLGYPHKSLMYQGLWLAAKRLVPGTIEQYQADTPDLPDPVREAVDSFTKLLNSIAI